VYRKINPTLRVQSIYLQKEYRQKKSSATLLHIAQLGCNPQTTKTNPPATPQEVEVLSNKPQLQQEKNITTKTRTYI
jgi:hypothetical protein